MGDIDGVPLWSTPYLDQIFLELGPAQAAYHSVVRNSLVTDQVKLEIEQVTVTRVPLMTKSGGRNADNFAAPERR
jgi:hypothetical protein